MIHDNEKDRMEYIDFLKENKIYNVNASAHEMQIGHEIYWTIKDKESKEK